MAFTGKDAKEWLIPAAVIAAGYAFWKFAAAPLLEGTGLKDSKEDVTRQKVETQQGNKDYWRGSWFRLPPSQLPIKDVKGLVLLNGANTANYIGQLYSAMYGPGTNEEKVYGVFRQLKYKSQVSWLVYSYYQKYKLDLYQQLRSELSDSEMNTVLQITEKLPWGIVTSSGVKGFYKKC